MIDGFFSYRPAYNPVFTPVVGPYQVTRHAAAAMPPPRPAISPRAALTELQTAGDQAQCRQPITSMWSQRTPASVTTGGLVDVYDTDQ